MHPIVWGCVRTWMASTSLMHGAQPSAVYAFSILPSASLHTLLNSIPTRYGPPSIAAQSSE
eukprot:2371046-Amphidinium_carterae.1